MKEFWQQFWEEYGSFIIAAIAILLLIAIVTVAGPYISDYFYQLLDTFQTQATSAIPTT